MSLRSSYWPESLQRPLLLRKNSTRWPLSLKQTDHYCFASSTIWPLSLKQRDRNFLETSSTGWPLRNVSLKQARAKETVITWTKIQQRKMSMSLQQVMPKVRFLLRTVVYKSGKQKKEKSGWRRHIIERGKKEQTRSKTKIVLKIKQTRTMNKTGRHKHGIKEKC